MGGLNWGAGLRSLGDVFRTIAAGQAEQQQAETLRQLIEQQRQQALAERAAAGLPAVSYPALPAAPTPAPGFWGGLQGLGQSYAAGLSKGSPELEALRFQLQSAQGDLTGARSFQEALLQAKKQDELRRGFATFQNQLPLGVGEREAMQLQMQKQKELQDMMAARQAAQAAQEFQYSKQLRGIPQAQGPSAEERMFGRLSPEQRAQYLQDFASGGTRGGFQERLFNSMSPEQQADYVQRLATGMPEGRILPAGEIDKINSLVGTLNEARTLAEMDVESFAGPGTGRMGKVRETLGLMGESETSFRRVSGNLSDMLLRARSGAAITESEFARMSRFMPQPTDSPGQFRVKLKEFQREMGSLLRTKAQLLKSAGYRVPDELLSGQIEAPGGAAGGGFTDREILEELRRRGIDSQLR